jgi:hypothetical protein
VRFITPTPQPVFLAIGPVGGVQWENTETTLDPKVNYTAGQSLIQLGENEQYGQHPRGFGFRKSRIFGNPGQDVRRGILTNCADFFFIDGRIEEIHQRGSDSQAICGWNAGEGHLIRNAVPEAASENIMYGGAGNTGANMNPRDITLENVTLSKRKEWDPNSPTFAGIRWNIKNHLEFKIGQRVRVNGLHCINCRRTDRKLDRHFASRHSRPAVDPHPGYRYSKRFHPGRQFGIRAAWPRRRGRPESAGGDRDISDPMASNVITAHGEHGWSGADGEGTRVRKLSRTQSHGAGSLRSELSRSRARTMTTCLHN